LFQKVLVKYKVTLSQSEREELKGITIIQDELNVSKRERIIRSELGVPQGQSRYLNHLSSIITLSY